MKVSKDRALFEAKDCSASRFRGTKVTQHEATILLHGCQLVLYRPDGTKLPVSEGQGPIALQSLARKSKQYRQLYRSFAIPSALRHRFDCAGCVRSKS